eukprot:scaffold2657_cov89-Amphora_coffeaeformis.AAC.18
MNACPYDQNYCNCNTPVRAVLDGRKVYVSYTVVSCVIDLSTTFSMDLKLRMKREEQGKVLPCRIISENMKEVFLQLRAPPLPSLSLYRNCSTDDRRQRIFFATEQEFVGGRERSPSCMGSFVRSLLLLLQNANLSSSMKNK